MVSLSLIYNQNNPQIVEDTAQLEVLSQLEPTIQALTREAEKRQRFLKLSSPKSISGIYLWGGVGTGKTFLMDVLFERLSFPQKKRMHFFNFMQYIHTELKTHRGQTNPLRFIGRMFAKETYVLYLDEFFVDNIVDAMLLSNLLTTLFHEGVCILTTSNIHPDLLYERGLQREQFIPAIEVIKKHMRVIHLQTQIDYRRIHQAHEHSPQPEPYFEKIFHRKAGNKQVSHEDLMIYGRPVPCRKRAENIIWFEFDDICRIPRSHIDYLAIVSQYKCILCSNIPHITEDEKNTIRLLIAFIDVIYDAKTEFIFSTNVEITDIYTAGDMIFQFQRTLSRLIELRSLVAGREEYKTK